MISGCYVRISSNTMIKDSVASESENEIAEAIQACHGFLNWCGIVDGTLFPWEFKPTIYGEDYFINYFD